jgi:prepilin peptidase CpaA
VFAGSTFGVLAGVVFTILLASGCLSDLRTRRIPNQLVLALAVLGLAYNCGMYDFSRGLLHGFAGATTGLAVWLPFWLLGWLGAGDVKFFAGASAWLGMSGALQAAGVAAVAGGLLTIVWLGWERGIRVAVEKSMIAMIHPKVLASPSATITDRRRLVPYGIALAVGLLAVAWFPSFLFL